LRNEKIEDKKIAGINKSPMIPKTANIAFYLPVGAKTNSPLRAFR